MKRLCLVASICFLAFGCKVRQPNNAIEQAEAYETRAQSYEAMANVIGISPPYDGGHRQTPPVWTFTMMNANLRMLYLKEAKRFRKLAESERRKAKK
jgi:hypothetical protein